MVRESQIAPESAAWGEHLIWMEGGEMPAPTETTGSRWLGILTCLLIAIVAGFVASLPLPGIQFLDRTLLCILIGLLLGNTLSLGRWRPGIAYSMKTLLPIGIVLLGARLDFRNVLQVGATGLLLSAGVVIAGFALILAPARLWKIDRTFATLLATGTAICGGTAIVAIAPVLRAKQKDIAVNVALVTLVGLVGMIVLPIVGRALQLDEATFGVWAGLTIHQTPQVMASGFAYGPEAGETATVVKLARVCLLAPVVLLASLLLRKKEGTTSNDRRPTLVPWFVVGFLLLALIRSLGFFPEISIDWPGRSKPTPRFEGSSADLLSKAGGLLLAAAMVGVGAETRFDSFRRVGRRPLLLGVGASITIAAVTLLALLLTRS